VNSSEKALHSIAKRQKATDFELEVVVDPARARAAESVLAEAHALLDAVEESLSEYRESALVRRLNRSAAGEWIPLDAFFAEALDLSRRYSRETGAAFTPFARSPFAASFDDLEIDAAGKRVRRRREDLLVGFGAIGKGYALDRVAALLDREGYSDYRLGAGGSSWVFRGWNADDRPWEVAWAWAKDADGDFVGQAYALPPGKAIAIGVSGTVEKGEHFLWQGAPLRASVRSAFCSASSAAEADAISTGLLVGASREGEGFLTKIPDSGIHRRGLAYVDLEGQMIYNQGFNTQFLREGRDPR
jgi:thiamine biosynthesis lipoprotein